MPPVEGYAQGENREEGKEKGNLGTKTCSREKKGERMEDSTMLALPEEVKPCAFLSITFLIFISSPT